ncbi:MAG TPA: HEAT repeat domain-containing protein [Gemmataceae bacterium]|nr:HEAT repeat domain-containing protein [Gemmataceae bacterium]
MTAHQKNGFRIAGIGLAIAAVLAVPFIYSAFCHRRIRLRLDDPSPAVRVAALRATGYEGNVDLLMKGLQDEDADVRLVAAMQLQRRGAQAAPSARALVVASLKDNHVGVRREAAEALHDIGAAAAPALIEALGDPDPRIRAKAAGALCVVAATSREQPPSADALASAAVALENVLHDEDAEVQKNAADSLDYIRRAEAGERLFEGK